MLSGNKYLCADPVEEEFLSVSFEQENPLILIKLLAKAHSRASFGLSWAMINDTVSMPSIMM